MTGFFIKGSLGRLVIATAGASSDVFTDFSAAWSSFGIYAWLVLAVVLLIAEMVSLGLTTIWFAGGSLAAFVFSLFHAPVWLQFAVFVAVSVVLLVFTRPIAMKYYNSRVTKTNAESLIGEGAMVSEAIDNLRAQGAVRLKGLEWTARSESDELSIPEGEVVTVCRIEGVKLIVVPKKQIKGGEDQ